MGFFKELSSEKSTPDETLKEYCNMIQTHIQNVKDSFVSIGYFLKKIRDKSLFQQAGYISVADFAQATFGFSKSTTSRFIAIHDKFGEPDKPQLKEKYEDYSKGQLQEMLTMSEEQLQQINSEMTVKEIREVSQKSVLEKDIYQEIHGQVDMDQVAEVEYIGERPTGQQDEVAISQPEMIAKPEKREDKKTEPVTSLSVEEKSPSVSEIMPEPEKRVPVLKNNAQRRDWINNYKKWGLWHRNPHLNITYYRYVFPDGICLIAEEMPPQKLYWREEMYTQVIFHLLGKQPEETAIKTKYSGNKFNVYEEFRHGGNSETEIIEFLKYERNNTNWTPKLRLQ